MTSRLPSPRAFVRELRTEFDPLIPVLAVGDLVSSFGFAIAFPFLSLYLTAALGATIFQAGLLLGAYGICKVVSNVIGGWLADRVGRRPVMIGSLGATAALLGALSIATDITTTAALLLAVGLVDPAFVPAARAAVADVVPETQRPRAYALLAVAQNIGWIAGPAIGAFLSTISYSLLFRVAAIAVATYAIILIRYSRETLVSRAEGRGAQPRTEVNLEPSFRPVARFEEVQPLPRPSPHPRWVFLSFLALMFFTHVAEAQWFTTLPVYAVDNFGIGPEAWGLLFALNGLLIVLCQLPLTRQLERHARLLMIAIGCAAFGVSYALVAVIPVPGDAIPYLVVMMVLITLGEIVFIPMLPAFATDSATPSSRGRYLGLVEASVAAGAVLGPPIGGYVLEHAPGDVLWVGSAIVCFLGAGGLVVLQQRMARAAPGPRAASESAS